MSVPSSPSSQNNAPIAKKESKGTKNGSQDGDNHWPATCSGIRVVGARIYDSRNGHTCHQCRQKTMDFVAACKTIKGNKLCTIKFCHKCLLNRYGENAEDVALLDNWKCPRCRNICNCSVCMKKRGHKPTGILVRTAKATGFSSVSHMLHLEDPDNSGIDMNAQNTGLLTKNPTSPRKESVVTSPRKSGKENSLDGKTDAYSSLKNASSTSDFIKGKKIKREGLKEIGNGNRVSDGVNPKVSKNITKSVGERNWRDDCALSETKSPKKRVFADVSLCPATPNKHEDESELNDGGKQQGAVTSKVLKGDDARANPIVKKLHKTTKDVETKEVHADLPLPEGTVLTTVAGIEFPPGDVGHVLQLLEFCEAFGKALSVKKVQAEAILRELRLGKKETRQRQSSLVRFHIKLLSLIREDLGEESSYSCSNNAWFEDLKEFISESACLLRELSSVCDVKEYEHLDFSKKLKLLNFLCDEILGTTKLRNWIEDENSKFLQKDKEAREKVVAAKSKEKNLKQQLQDRIAKAIIAKKGAPLTISEHEAIISRIKTKADQAHAEMLEATDAVPKRKQRSNAVRMKPIVSDSQGRALWKLGCYSDEDILLQDIGSWSEDITAENWFMFNPEQQESLEKYIFSVSRQRRKTTQ